MPTPTAYPTNTPYPTGTPQPTYTPYPTPTAVATATPYPTNTPYPTATPDVRYVEVTPTPEPTLGPLENWQEHSPRPYYSIHLPSDFSKNVDYPEDLRHWGRVKYSLASNRVQVLIDDGSHPDDADLHGVAGSWLRERYNDYAFVRTLRFDESSIANALRVSYVAEGQVEGYCDVTYHVLLVRGETRTYMVRIVICDSARWKYDDEFAERLLNSFTWQ